MSELRLPDTHSRLVVVGRTGSGKTQAGAFHLSNQDTDTFPWVVIDTKGDGLLKRVYKRAKAKQLSLSSPIPTKGLWYMRPTIKEMNSPLAEDFLARVHKRGRCGLYFDEGYTLNKYSDALTSIYTQGRSLEIPTITLSQKPSYLNMFTFSEATFFQVFALNYKDDRKRIAEYTPISANSRLPRYNSWWYDVEQDLTVECVPVPAAEQILDRFHVETRLQTRVI